MDKIYVASIKDTESNGMIGGFFFFNTKWCRSCCGSRPNRKANCSGFYGGNG